MNVNEWRGAVGCTLTSPPTFLPPHINLLLTGEYGRRQALLDQLDVLGSKGAQQEVERSLLEEPHR